jgi:hypothetical protein
MERLTRALERYLARVAFLAPNINRVRAMLWQEKTKRYKRQKSDSFTLNLLNRKSKQFVKIDDVLFHSSPNRNEHRLVLPNNLLDALIVSKHITVFGLHHSRTRMQREIASRYFVDMRTLNFKLNALTKSCIQCQFNSSSPKQHILKQTNFVYAPRVTWAVDIIPSMTTTPKGNSAIFLAVDMFTGYVQLKPLKSRKTDELIEAVKSTIILPFGIPKYFRCDNESAMANSTEFHKFMEPLGVQFLPCSTASPWSNGAAERAVQTIKKTIRTFSQQENVEDRWDDYLHFFVSAHNKSTSIYGFSPEQLHFGFSNPAITDLIEIWPKTIDQQDYAKQIFTQIEKARQAAREKAKAWNKSNITYRNLKREDKKFLPGQIVLHRQLQVSTGSGGALKPLFTGPYIVNSIDKDKSSASLEHLHTGRQISAHFTNIQIFHFDPSQSRLPQDFDDQIDKLFPEKYSFAYYHPRSVAKRQILNERAKALQREQEYLEEMPLAQRFPSSKSRRSKTPPKAINQPPNFQSIKITLDPSPSQIKSIDNPLNDATLTPTTKPPFSPTWQPNNKPKFESDRVEQNFVPQYLANKPSEQFPKLIHTQNRYDDLNDQIYDRDDLQDEPYFPACADFQTDDSYHNDSQHTENDTPHSKSEQEQYSSKFFNQQTDNFYNLNSENQNDISRSYDNREIVMANDEAFGALDFRNEDINLEFDNDSPSRLVTTFPQKTSNLFSPDVEKQPSNNSTTSGDKQHSDINPNNISPNPKLTNDKTPKLESDVEDGPHTETEPQLLQQRDNVPTTDPVPDSKYNLRNKDRRNPYTFSGKVSEKWLEAPRRNRRRARSLDSKS